jgi:hypothetical protein
MAKHDSSALLSQEGYNDSRSMARITTRRTRLEQQKAKRNLILAIFVALGLGLLFLFVLIPLIFQFAIEFARSRDVEVQVSDTLPPQKPVFQPPQEFTAEKQLMIDGYTEASAQVELFVDGQSRSTTQADESGSFTFQLELEEGEHSIVVEAADAAGNTNSTEQYPVVVDVTVPTLQVEKPEEGQVFTLRTERVVTVEGQMSEAGTVYVNGSLNTTDQDGKFRTNVTLGEGENILKIRGEDKAGNASEEQEIKVRYQP